MTLQIGDKAPDFTLPADNGSLIKLSALRGKKVLVYFYPKDNTPGCTREACDIRDQFTRFTTANTTVLGISKDSVTRHSKFKEKYKIPFLLLEDKEGNVCTAYGVINKKSLFGNTFLGITRSTFLIDEKGNIQQIWRKVKVAGHVEQILDEIN